MKVGEDGGPVALWAFVRADGARARAKVSAASTLVAALDAAPGQRGLWDAPTGRAAIDQTMIAFLDVTFEVLGLGANAVQFRNRLAVDRVLVDTAEFTCKTWATRASGPACRLLMLA